MIRTTMIALAATMALSACQPEKPAEPAPPAVTPEATVMPPPAATTPVDPAAEAYLAGADKAFALLADAKDVAGVEAAKPQITAIYAEMAGPAATLKAMTPEQRVAAFGSEAAMKSVLDKVGNVLGGKSYSPETLQAVGAVIDQMPKME